MLFFVFCFGFRLHAFAAGLMRIRKSSADGAFFLIPPSQHPAQTSAGFFSNGGIASFSASSAGFSAGFKAGFLSGGLLL
jgi:hypothetical protein